MAREKIKFALRIAPETQQLVKELCERDNCQSQNEFIEKAIRFYVGYLSGNEAGEYLPQALVDAFRATLRDSENHISRLLFKLAVEVDILMHVLASAVEIDPAILDKLRGVCVREIKKSNGMIRLEDVVLYQQGADKS
mgnify:FL=1